MNRFRRRKGKSVDEVGNSRHEDSLSRSGRRYEADCASEKSNESTGRRDDPPPEFDRRSSSSIDDVKVAAVRGNRKGNETDSGRLDLPTLLRQKNWKQASARLTNCPQEAERFQLLPLYGDWADQSRALPLHLALALQPPTRVVEDIVQAFPGAVELAEEKWGRLPLHVACISSAGVDVMDVLLRVSRKAITAKDKASGRIPLHYSCIWGTTPEVELLLTSDPSTLNTRDGLGQTAVVIAKNSGNPYKAEIVRYLEQISGIYDNETVAQLRKHSKTRRSSAPDDKSTANVQSLCPDDFNHDPNNNKKRILKPFSKSENSASELAEEFKLIDRKNSWSLYPGQEDLRFSAVFKPAGLANLDQHRWGDSDRAHAKMSDETDPPKKPLPLTQGQIRSIDQVSARADDTFTKPEKPSFVNTLNHEKITLQRKFPNQSQPIAESPRTSREKRTNLINADAKLSSSFTEQEQAPLGKRSSKFPRKKHSFPSDDSVSSVDSAPKPKDNEFGSTHSLPNNDRAEMSMDDLINSLVAKKMELSTKQNTMKDIEMKIVELDRKEKNLHNQTHRVKTAVVVKDEAVNKQKRRIKELHDDLDSILKKIGEAEEDLASATKELETEHRNFETHNELIQTYGDEKTELESERKKLESSVSQLHEKVKATNYQIKTKMASR